MSRRHAFYKMVALVQGVNLVKKELGLPVTPSLAADPKLLAPSDDVDCGSARGSRLGTSAAG